MEEHDEFANARAVMRDLWPREARWRYFQRGNGPMFVWTVEPFNLRYGGTGQGKYESVVYKQFGPGSRKGTAKQWKRDEKTASLHVLRKDAKARALRLFEEWKEERASKA